MPTLALDPAIDTTAPGLTRRRVWAAPAVKSHSLIAMTLAKLHLAPASAKGSIHLAEKIQNGADIESTLGPLATVVEIPKIEGVKFNLVHNSLAIDYRPRSNDPSRRDQAPSRVIIEFSTHDAADEVYTKLWRRLGEKFELKQARQSGWDLARFPVAVMAGVLVLTAAFAIVGNAANDSDGASSWFKLFTAVDWRLICGLGGAFLALLQVWLYRRVTQPPTELELGPKYL